jgi:pimeloyl-ACP methyl ester carboxylesterase
MVPPEAKTIDTSEGRVQYADDGEGAPLLFVHGSPGGCDQGLLMTRFLLDRGHRVVALSRPGYLETPLTDTNATPDAQTALEVALMDALNIERFGLMCWSGGGPSSYRLAATCPERVSALVAVAAVSKPLTFKNTGEELMLMTRFGRWLTGELTRHAPKETVKMLAKEEGDLSKDEVKELTKQILEDPVKRQWALDLMETVAGDRKTGFKNDMEQYPKLDLDLGSVKTKTLLVHATSDSDVPFEYSEFALEHLPSAELHRVEGGTHVSAWTDPDSDSIQDRIASFLAAQ